MNSFCARSCVIFLTIGVSAEGVFAQRATLTYKPAGGAYRRECVGGPNDGNACTSTADCEEASPGVVFPECIRVCVGEDGLPDGLPCALGLSQCLFEETCRQRCLCNYVVQPVFLPAVIPAEVEGKDWDGSLQGYQVSIDFSDTIDRVHPFGWNCISDILCGFDADCPAEFPFCWLNPDIGAPGFCACPNHAPEIGVYIDTTRTDWVFFGQAAFTARDLSPTIRFLAAVPSMGVSYPDEPRYFGTVNLWVERAACRRVNIPLGSPPDSLLVGDFIPHVPMDLESLSVDLGPCEPTPGCFDKDRDGFGSPGDAWCSNGLADDCDDTDEEIFPGAAEMLCNGVDENCNGMADDDQNLDRDPASVCDGDCDDSDPEVYPGNTEVCDGKDNDCDGLVDGFRFGRWVVWCVPDKTPTHVGE